ncbi:MAG: hypothetical protein QXQ43_00685 [Nitrososphaerota archaeon]
MSKNNAELIKAKDAQALSDIRSKILEFKKNITKTYIDLARLLAKVSENVVSGKPIYKHWGYDTFARYCEEELNISVRKAEMLIAIAKFVDNKILVDPAFKGKEEQVLAEIDQIGWVKAYLLPRVVVTPKDFDRWINAAKKMGKKEFRELVVGKKVGDDIEESGKPQKFISFNLKLISSGADIVNMVFDHIRKVNGENLISGPVGDGMVLVRLCQHYLSNLSDNSYSIEGILSSIMDTYDIDELTIKYSNGEIKTISKKKGDGNAE